MLTAALKIAIVALSLGLDVFAVCVGVGMRGTARSLKIRIGCTFALAEVTMLLIGVAVGSAAGHVLGGIAGYFGFGALICVGAYMLYEARSGGDGNFDFSRGWGLLLGALSVSLDSLGIGFSILFIGVPLGVSLLCIASASVLSSTLGLTIGKALGARAEGAAAIWAGAILICTGLGFTALKIAHVG